MEYLDLYDEKKKKLNKKIVRGDKINSGEHILLSIIFIKNKEGKYLIQKTSKEKGGLFSSTGGHVISGENSKETIIREVKEELGIDISSFELKYIGNILLGVPFADIYYLEKNININDIKLQEEEVESVTYMTDKKINNLIIDKKMLKSHGLIFTRFFMNN